jgi:hypothetical protein
VLAFDEIRNVGLGHGAADRLEPAPDRQVFEVQPETEYFHPRSPWKDFEREFPASGNFLCPAPTFVGFIYSG